MSLENELLAQRLERVREIEKMGYAPYGHRFDFSHTAAEIVAKADEYTAESLEATRVPVKICGRIMTIRRMGKRVSRTSCRTVNVSRSTSRRMP